MFQKAGSERKAASTLATCGPCVVRRSILSKPRGQGYQNQKAVSGVLGLGDLWFLLSSLFRLFVPSFPVACEGQDARS